MGVHQFWDTEKVIENAVTMCTVTHHDQRCEASAVAVSVAISLMLQRKYYDGNHFNVTDIIQESFKCACSRLSGPRIHENKEELKTYMFCQDIAELQLAERDSIGYTFKCVGAGFWALKQDNFRQAIQTVVMNAGDADTNGAVAGALLGCKLGGTSLPDTWLSGLLHKTWLDKKVDRKIDIGPITKYGYLTIDKGSPDLEAELNISGDLTIGSEFLQLKCLCTPNKNVLNTLPIFIEYEHDELSDNFISIVNFFPAYFDKEPFLLSGGSCLSGRVVLTNPTSKNTSGEFEVIITYNIVTCKDDKNYRCRLSYIDTASVTNVVVSQSERLIIKGTPNKPDNIPSRSPDSKIFPGDNVTLICSDNRTNEVTKESP
ncbi:Hypothetical predicted protein [Mytilus galloprovincialis]|nr:Hypothetical predicted protein [Mytilus galloprovincialis]